MTKTQALTPTDQTQALATVKLAAGGWLPQPETITEALALADVFANSGMVPEHYKGEPAMVLVAIQKGAELGLGPMFSLQNIAVIRGRPCLWGDAMLALVKSDPRCVDVIEVVHEDKQGRPLKGECTVLRHGKQPVTRTFSIADAKVAELWSKKGPWQQYPRRMLQLRARGFALRDSFPDRLAGLPMAEAVRDYRDENVVDARIEPQEGSFTLRQKQPEPIDVAPDLPPEKVDAEIKAIVQAIGKARSDTALDKLMPRVRAVPEHLRKPIRSAWTERRGAFDAEVTPSHDAETGEVEQEKEQEQEQTTSPSPRIREGAKEFLGMIARVENADEMAAAISSAATRKFTKAENAKISKALKAKDAELTQAQSADDAAPQAAMEF